jgi:hypothetical protein
MSNGDGQILGGEVAPKIAGLSPHPVANVLRSRHHGDKLVNKHDHFSQGDP